jgi:hypothetical protein
MFVLREHLLRGYTIKQPVALKHLPEVKQHLERQVAELRQQIDNLDNSNDRTAQRAGSRIGGINLQKKPAEEKSRRKTGFKMNNGVAPINIDRKKGH